MSEQPTRIDLHQLEQLSPPSDRLAAVLAGEISSSAAHQEGHQSSPSRRWPYLALAACALIAVGMAVILQQTPLGDAAPAPRALSADSELNTWIAYSQQLEQQLKAVAPASGVVRGHRAAAINVLHEELELIDLALMQTRQEDETLALWQARTTRLNDLVAVHAASANAQILNADRNPAGDPVITLQPPLAATASVVQL